VKQYEISRDRKTSAYVVVFIIINPALSGPLESDASLIEAYLIPSSSVLRHVEMMIVDLYSALRRAPLLRYVPRCVVKRNVFSAD